jgi:hypothetical protein
MKWLNKGKEDIIKKQQENDEKVEVKTETTKETIVTHTHNKR